MNTVLSTDEKTDLPFGQKSVQQKPNFVTSMLTQLKSKGLLPKSFSPKMLLAVVVGILVLGGMASASLLLESSQDIRQQAKGEVYTNIARGARCPEGVATGTLACGTSNNQLYCNGVTWVENGNVCNKVPPSEQVSDSGSGLVGDQGDDLTDPQNKCYVFDPASRGCREQFIPSNQSCQTSAGQYTESSACTTAYTSEFGTQTCTNSAEEVVNGGSCDTRGGLLQICRKGYWSSLNGATCPQPAQTEEDAVSNDSIAQNGTGSNTGIGGSSTAPTTRNVESTTPKNCGDRGQYEPGDRSCASGNSFVECQENGQFTATATQCPSDTRCSDSAGGCVTACTPGASSCVIQGSLAAYRVCASDGATWQTTQCQYGCGQNGCIQRACTPGEKVCGSGNRVLQTCNADGTAYDTAFCALGCNVNPSGADSCATAPVILTSSVCTPNAQACVGNLSGRCNAQGSALVAGFTDCEFGCSNGVCNSSPTVTAVRNQALQNEVEQQNASRLAAEAQLELDRQKAEEQRQAELAGEQAAREQAELQAAADRERAQQAQQEREAREEAARVAATQLQTVSANNSCGWGFPLRECPSNCYNSNANIIGYCGGDRVNEFRAATNIVATPEESVTTGSSTQNNNFVCWVRDFLPLLDSCDQSEPATSVYQPVEPLTIEEAQEQGLINE